MFDHMPLPVFGPLEIDFVHPEPPLGFSNPRYVRAENGRDYIIKGPSLTPNHPLVAANELIACQIAERLGIPVLHFAILAMGQELFFGSEMMERNTYDTLTQALYLRCANRSIIYGIVALDVWFVNGDRHENNLLARMVHQKGQEPRYELLANDHGHCLTLPEQDTRDLLDLINAPLDCRLRRPFVQINFVRDDITDATRMVRVVRQIEAITDQTVDDVIGSVPEVLMSADDRVVYGNFLKGRRNRLGWVFRNGGDLLPNLKGM